MEKAIRVLPSRMLGLEKVVEIKIQQQLPGSPPALHGGCSVQQILLKPRQLSAAEGTLLMKERLDLWVVFPALREIDESIVRVWVEVTDLVKVSFLLEHILVKKSGIGIDDRQFLDAYLGSAGRNIVGFARVLHLVVLEIVHHVVVANVSTRQAVRLRKEIVEQDEFTHVPHADQRLDVLRIELGGAEHGGDRP